MNFYCRNIFRNEKKTFQILFLIFLDSYGRDLSISGPYYFQRPKLDFIWIFEISGVLKVASPSINTKIPKKHFLGIFLEVWKLRFLHEKLSFFILVCFSIRVCFWNVHFRGVFFSLDNFSIPLLTILLRHCKTVFWKIISISWNSGTISEAIQGQTWSLEKNKWK